MSQEDEKSPLPLSLILLSCFAKQCSKPFETGTHELINAEGEIESIYTENGDVCIAPDPPGEQIAQEFERELIFPSDCDDSEVTSLSEELKALTEEICDIQLTNFQLHWGVTKEQSPFLIDCNESTYISNNDFNTPELIYYIVMNCFALPEPGVCFTNGTSCCGYGRNVNRRKAELYLAKQYALRTGIGDPDEVAEYIVKRISKSVPNLSLQNVMCCEKCFKKFARVTTNKNEKNAKRATTPSSTDDKSVVSTKPQTAASATKPDVVKTSMFARDKWKPFKKTHSGLTIVQASSSTSNRKAYELYSSKPFKPFLQHD